jgi:hypothetical protein
VLVGIVALFSIAGATAASAKTPPKHPKPTHLLPANLTCEGLVTAQDAGPDMIDVGSGPSCLFGYEPPKDAPSPPPPIELVNVTCAAYIPWNGANLLPTSKTDLLFSKMDIGTRAEMYFNDDENQALGAVQVRNAECDVQVEVRPDDPGLLGVAKAKQLMKLIASELGD